MSPQRQKVLLVKPPYNYYPMGLAYVASTLERMGIKYDYHDPTIHSGDVFDLIRANSYLAIASGGLVNDFRYLEQLFCRAKQIDPKLFGILGGHITKDVSPNVVMDHIQADVCVVGKAEPVLPIVINRLLENDKDFTGVQSVIYRNQDGQVIRNHGIATVDFQKNHVMPSFTFFDHHIWPINRFPIPITTGSGCPGACTFCSPGGRTFYARPFEDIFREVEFLINELNSPTISFLNEIMFDDEKMLVDFCREYGKRFNRPFSTVLRMDMNPAVLGELKRAGCYCINVGVESGSDEILKKMCKQISTQTIREFIGEAKRVGIPFIISGFLFGNEYESEDDIQKTLQFHDELSIQSGFGITVPYPGTALFRRAMKKGLIANEYQFLQRLERTYQHEFLSEVIFTKTADGNPLLPNISQISNDRVSDVIRDALVSYNSRFVLQNPALSVHDNKLIMTGECPVCGASMDIPFDIQLPYARGLSCPKVQVQECHNCISFHAHLHELKAVKEYSKPIAEMINRVRSVGFVGRAYMVKYLMEIDVFHVQLEKIVGVTLTDNSGCVYGDSYGNVTEQTRHIPLSTLIELDPDFIIVAEMPPSAKATFDHIVASGYGADRVFQMLPNNLVPYLDMHYWQAVMAVPPDARVVVWPADKRIIEIIDKGLVRKEQITALVDPVDTEAGGAHAYAVDGREYCSMPIVRSKQLERMDFDTFLCIAPENQAKILTHLHFRPDRKIKDVFCLAQDQCLYYVYGENLLRRDSPRLQ